jgi:hypothetical protein
MQDVMERPGSEARQMPSATAVKSSDVHSRASTALMGALAGAVGVWALDRGLVYLEPREQGIARKNHVGSPGR